MRFGRAGGRASLVLVAPIVALALTASAAAAVPTAHVTQVGAAPAGQPLDLVFPLLADESGLGRFATSVSTPGSIHYGQFEPIATLSARYGATAATKRKVVAYLHRVGASAIKIDSTGLFAYATVPAGLAQRLFGTPLAQFRTARGARFVAPTSSARVPSGLRGAVTDVIGLNTMPLSNSTGALRASGSSRFRAHAASRPTSALPRTGTVSSSACAAGASAGEIGGDPTTAGFAPNQYLTAYGFDPLHNAGFRGQGERVALIEIDGFRDSDIKAFARCFHLDIPALNGFGVGVKHPLPPGGESTLDLEVLDAAAPDLKAIDVYESKPTAADTLRSLTAPLQNRGFKPQVVSASLGLCEGALLGSLGASGVRSAESALQMATSAGITFLASSGDQGSADCTSMSGQPLGRLAVNYPASSWWVTGVGGTNFTLNAANQITGQLVWNDTFVQAGSAGGGGASELFNRPSYQKGTVGPNRRAVPDVSMLADIIPGYAIFCTASGDCSSSHPWTTVGGTSAATPLLAGGFALTDQDLRMHKRQDLGLANPLLYKIGRSSLAGGVFSDVLKYDNDIGPDVASIGHSLGCCRAGHGFDEASGWGSVNLASFAAVALQNQPSRQSITLAAHQHPLRSHKIVVTVSCALACRAAAFALVGVGKAKPFEVDSSAFTLPAGGKKTLSLRFNSGQQRKLRSGVSHNRRIEAEVAGVILDSHNHVQAQTPGKFLTIRR
jgi:subtilase family serine protease